MKKLKIWWIDDEIDRLDQATRRAIMQPRHEGFKGCKSDLEPKEIKNEDEIYKLIADIAGKARKNKDLPNLLVIDQRLLLQTGGDVKQRGSSLAVAIRTQAPQVPLVGVSGVPNKDQDFTTLQREQFIEFFTRDSISSSERIPDLYAIAEGFEKVWQVSTTSKPQHKDIFIQLLNIPTEEIDLLLSCLPGKFKGSWDLETAHLFSRWVWHTLLGRAGFTYDDLETATLLGLTPAGFNKISDQFSKCIYRGAFTSFSRRRWWLSLVRNTARKIANAHNSRPIWEIGRDILGGKDTSLFSKCYGKRKTDCIPDVVAFKDDRHNTREQVDSSDTDFIETDSRPIGFEPLRVFRPKKNE